MKKNNKTDADILAEYKKGGKILVKMEDLGLQLFNISIFCFLSTFITLFIEEFRIIATTLLFLFLTFI